jgi:DNA-binding transcriptional MocR family regulator
MTKRTTGWLSGRRADEIAQSVESAIRDEQLAPGDALPTVRAAARMLRVSPATVASAYRRLRERGLLVTRGRLGTAVSSRPPIHGAAALLDAPPPHVRDLAAGNPDPARLPPLGPALRSLDPEPRLYGQGLVDPELLRVARRQLARDGVPNGAVGVVSGALDGIERVLLAHLRPGDRIAVEDPCWNGVLALVQALGLRPVGVACDERGLRPDALEAAFRNGVEACIATPRAQNPTGAMFDSARAAELEKVLGRFPRALWIEDDHAGAVAGVPLYSLCDASRARFAYVRSVSKTLGPDLRLGVLSADPETLARVEGRQLIGMRWVSHVLQALVAALWRQKGMQARLREAARSYTRRRRALLAELADRGIPATGASGLNVWIPVPEEARIVAGLLEAGFAVAPGERFRLRTPPAIRVTTSSLEPDEAAAFASALADLLEPAGRTTAA